MKDVYDKIYRSLDYGPISTARGLQAARHIELLFKPCKTLCVGSGNSYEAAFLSMIGFDVTTVDYIQPRPKMLTWHQVKGRGQHLPFKDDTFDLVMCCECLEHIPEKEIDLVLSELRRVSLYFYFTIDDQEDPPYNSHICVHPYTWWVDKFKKHGLAGKLEKPAKYFEKCGELMAPVRYANTRGFNIYGNKVLQK